MSGRLRSAARRRRAGARLAASLVCSVAINLLILALLPVSPRVELPLPPNDVDDEIAYVPVEVEVEPRQLPFPTLDPDQEFPPAHRIRVAVETTPPLPVEQPPPEEPPPKPERDRELHRENPDSLRSVHQPRDNEQIPLEANYLAEVDNTATVETLAEDTTLFDAAPEIELAGEREEPDELSDLEEGAVEHVLTERTESLDDEMPDPEDYLDDVAPRVTVGSEAQPTAPSAPEMLGDSTPPTDGTVEPPDSPSDAREVGVAEQVELSLEAAAPLGGLEAFRLTLPRVDSSGNPYLRSPLREFVEGHAGAYVEVFGARDGEERALVEREARQASFLGDHAGRWDRTRATLENFDVQGVPGRETSLNTRRDEVAGYVHYLHNKMHERWWGFLGWLELTQGPADGMSDLSLVVDLEVVITRQGEVRAVNIVDGSGELEFDATAVDLMYDIGPHRAPPPGIVSGDGNAYVYWSFHRGTRGCGTFGAATRRYEFEEGEGG